MRLTESLSTSRASGKALQRCTWLEIHSALNQPPRQSSRQEQQRCLSGSSSAADGHIPHSHMTSSADTLLDESRNAPCRALQRCTWPDPHSLLTSGAGSSSDTSRKAPGRAMQRCTWPDLHSNLTSGADELTDRSKRGACQGAAALHTA